MYDNLPKEYINLYVEELCKLLPYGLWCYHEPSQIVFQLRKLEVIPIYNGNTIDKYDCYVEVFTDEPMVPVSEIKPYLKPLFSMSEEEKLDMKNLLSPQGLATYENTGITLPASQFGLSIGYSYMGDIVNYLRMKHFDIYNFISKDLAIVACKDTY